jgi:hypothetical protein
MAENASISFAEPMAIFLHGRRRHRWILESWMAVNVRRKTPRNIVTRGPDSVMKSVLGDLAIVGRRWWNSVNNCAMSTTCQSERRQKCGGEKNFSHV